MGPLLVVRIVLRQKQLHFLLWLMLAPWWPGDQPGREEKALVDDPTWPEL